MDTMGRNDFYSFGLEPRVLRGGLNKQLDTASILYSLKYAAKPSTMSLFIRGFELRSWLFGFGDSRLVATVRFVATRSLVCAQNFIWPLTRHTLALQEGLMMWKPAPF